MPIEDTAPTVGRNPTTFPNIAGTRPDPAVSVPSATGTIPAATATPDPDDDPPGARPASNGARGVPYGLRTPTSPVANWSRFVLPMTTAPAPSSRATATASCAGMYE